MDEQKYVDPLPSSRNWEALYLRHLKGESPEMLARETGVSPMRLRDKFLQITHKDHPVHNKPIKRPT
jgi:hypothetical protein